MATKKDLATKEEGALAIHDYGSDLDTGYENVGQEDYVLPFLNLLQALSPEVTDEDGAGVEGAKAGMLYNPVTQQLVAGDEGVPFVPAYVEKAFVEWVPRQQGGGFVARHEMDSEVVRNAKGRGMVDIGNGRQGLTTESGNHLVETKYIYGVMSINGEVTGCVISFTSTKITVYRKLMTRLNMFTVPGKDGRKVRPPLFAHQLRVKSTSQKNAKGSFYNYDIVSENGDLKDSLLAPDDELFLSARQLREAVQSGAAKMGDESGGGGAGGGGGDATSDDIPF